MKKHLSDVLIGIGLLTFSVGVWFIYPPASLLFIGAALCAVGFLAQ